MINKQPQVMRKMVIAYGEILWDILPSQKTLGGAPANFIFRMNNFGDKCSLISSVGNDTLGQEALQQVRQLELSDEYVQVNHTYPTGTVPVTLDEKGIPDFTITKQVAFDYIEPKAELITLAEKASCICFGTLIQREEKSRNTLLSLLGSSPKAIKFLDINLRKECYTKSSIIESLQLANILKLNDEELFVLKSILGLKEHSLKKLCAEIIEQYQLELALVTLGEKGAFTLSKTGEYYYDQGYRIKLKDTIGSGDACSAGFMHSYINGESLNNSLKFGNAAGAIVATTSGGTTKITKEEIIQFLNEKHNRISI